MTYLRSGCLIVLFIAGATACADATRIDPPAAASGAEHTVSFAGHAYDGASGTRLATYTIEATIADALTAGVVDTDSGRYTLGNFSPWDDYTVEIAAEGYRPFISHNPSIGLPGDFAQSDDIAEIGSHQTLHFDAYLFPTDVLAPAVTFTITTLVAGQEMPSGSIRLRPTTQSLLQDTAAETPGGVPGQVWTNDEDLQTGILSSTFSGGEFNIGGGDLVYGVTYQVDIFNVPGFQPFTASFTAGILTSRTFTLIEEIADPLLVTMTDHLACTPPASSNSTSGATINVEFNATIELVDTGLPGGAAEAVDDTINIVSADQDMDMIQNSLKPDLLDGDQERGMSVSIAGDTLTISWNPSLGLDMNDPDDPITQVTYGGFANVVIQRAGMPSSAAALSTLIGAGSVICD